MNNLSLGRTLEGFFDPTPLIAFNEENNNNAIFCPQSKKDSHYPETKTAAFSSKRTEYNVINQIRDYIYLEECWGPPPLGWQILPKLVWQLLASRHFVEIYLSDAYLFISCANSYLRKHCRQLAFEVLHFPRFEATSKIGNTLYKCQQIFIATLGFT